MEPMNEHNDPESIWIKQVREGQRDGFEALYRHYYAALSQFAYRYVKSASMAEDVAHEVFHNLWKNREGLKPVKTLRSYLYTATRNEALKYLDKREQQQANSYISNLSLIKSPNNESIEFQADNEGFERAYKQAVSELPNKRRNIYLLSREDNLTYKEIAQVLDISIKTVETQMSRSLQHLREKLRTFFG